MIRLIARLFIKKNDSAKDERHAIGTACGILGIILNLLLFFGKLMASLLTGSVSIRADAFNNLSDAGTALVTACGFHLSRQQPDTRHPFGHGRIEYISGMAVSMFVLLMGFNLLELSIERIFSPHPVDHNATTLIVLTAAVFIKLIMYVYNRHYGKKLSSSTLYAASIDSISDAISTTAILITSLMQEHFGWHIDGYVGCVVSLIIFMSAFKSMKATMEPLLGQPPDSELIDQIRSITLSHSDVVGIHDLTVHDYGPGRKMISLHAEVPAEGDMMLLHDTIDNVEHELRETLCCDAVIHMDPIVTSDECTAHMKERIGELVKALDERAAFHDFRMVKGPTHTNLIFDVEIPFDLKATDDQLRERMTHMVRALDENYFIVMQIDRK